VVGGETYYYIANSGWGALNPDGSVKRGATMTASRVMKWQPAAP
jgi:hypothetical protein